MTRDYIGVNEIRDILKYCQDQYSKGYADAIKNKKELLDLIYDINPEEIAAQIASGNLHNWCLIFKREARRLLNE